MASMHLVMALKYLLVPLKNLVVSSKHLLRASRNLGMASKHLMRASGALCLQTVQMGTSNPAKACRKELGVG